VAKVNKSEFQVAVDFKKKHAVPPKTDGFPIRLGKWPIVSFYMYSAPLKTLPEIKKTSFEFLTNFQTEPKNRLNENNL
ncbi:MAG: hypothetical protein LOD92_05585, partial [Bacillales bacterium]